MNWRAKREVIATLLRAGRPDLAQYVVARSDYWKNQVKKSQSIASQLRKTTLLHADYVRKTQGPSSYLYKNLLEAAASLDRYSALVEPLKEGGEEGVVPMTPKRNRPQSRPILRAAEVQRAG